MSAQAPANRSIPLGARWDGAGTSFAIASRHASAIELCIFDPSGREEIARHALAPRGEEIWHAYLPHISPGALYGYRAHGPWDPGQRQRFNAKKLLVDPYARALVGRFSWSDSLFAHDLAEPTRPSPLDSADFVPRSLVVDPRFDWGDDRPVRVPWRDTVIYEAHVRGLTRLHPAVPPEERGTFRGLAHPAVLEHLKALHVTTLELMPIAACAPDPLLGRTGRSNYWGYASVAFSAPDSRFASGDRGEQIAELRELVRALHRAGFEVILDVVYNHTAESGAEGPTYSLRGLDDGAYYRRVSPDSDAYEDLTGCGNTLELRESRTLALVRDSLRVWVEEFRVDGFRFDLASALAREPELGHPDAPLLALLRDDPVLREVKLIAEPWDTAGYGLGRFPAPWVEWNDRFRDTVRRYWRGDPVKGELAGRIAGSHDLFGARAALASVNFVACHDGFTLADVVAYAVKHNESNGEENLDGSNENASANWGVEGPSDEPAILALRAKAKRNLIATLAFAQGVPMLGHGDELSRSQAGNNNAYCHDSELTWCDWKLDDEARAFLAFVRKVFALRAENPIFRRPEGLRDPNQVRWLTPDGDPLDELHWHDGELRAFQIALRPEHAGERAIVLLLNAAARDCTFTVPSPRGGRWASRLSTGAKPVHAPRRGRVKIEAHSLALLDRRRVR